MAIAVEMTFAGATVEQYDQVIEKMGFRPGGPGAEGGLFHWVTAEPGGIRVVDVWNSIEEFQRFAAEKIGPITRSVGVPGEPEVRTYPVHSYLTAG